MSPDKVVFVGDSGVGKTALLYRRLYGSFERRTQLTIGVDFSTQKQTEGRVFSLWDTAGQERFRSLAAQYYRNAAAIVFVYDLSATNSSFGSLESRWLAEARTHAPDSCALVVVGNKCDHARAASVDQPRLDAFVRNASIAYSAEVSALTNEGVDKLFDTLEQLISERATRERDEPLELAPPRSATRCC